MRNQAERSGSNFFQNEVEDFNNFIINSDLVDVPLEGRRFMRVDKLCSKMKKLDRFLVSNGILNSYPNLIGVVLTRLWSDHAPIVLKEEHRDYGPAPFKLFHSWFLWTGLTNWCWMLGNGMMNL